MGHKIGHLGNVGSKATLQKDKRIEDMLGEVVNITLATKFAADKKPLSKLGIEQRPPV
uniref:Uncharacterized protein n=1 Tax=Arion vulgaris TaxID=1028688 RepID=A0A0B7AMQ6_9EUPU